MQYQRFVDFARMQDAANQFSSYHGDLSRFPPEVRKFYQNCDPVDVELLRDGTVIAMVSAEQMPKLQEMYGYLGAALIIATCNGDPIYLKEGKVYTCMHGTHTVRPEFLAEGFDAYIDSFME